MARRKRHSTTEIEVKLEKADALAADNHNQNEIAKALGISVMTLHRWRKASPSRPFVAPDAPSEGSSARQLPLRQQPRIAELELENGRLRRLVTNLLLEKMRLEDERHLYGDRKSRPAGQRAQLVVNR
jgi:putative transposase